MAKLNFSFSGERIKAPRLESALRHFQLEFEYRSNIRFGSKTYYSVECFYSIHRYASCFSEAFHLVAADFGVHINNFNVQIEGNVNLAEVNQQKSSVFDEVSIVLDVDSDADYQVLELILAYARELYPVNALLLNDVHFNYSLGSVIHLN